ncbi:MAG: polysaccharide pyruvyl transferase family protein [Anaerolineae bacterium]|nr:polysaccharide pyruvyl transferase family protein [Anaerolineae bacterium]
MAHPKLVFSNTYGHPNVGDEAIVTAMVQELRHHLGDVQISFLSSWPKLSRQNHPDLNVIESKSFIGVKATTKAIREADLLIVGGGGIIQDATSLGNLLFHLSRMVIAHITKTPFMAYAIGVGPLTSKVSRSVTKSILSKAEIITVRDQASADLLHKIGFPLNQVQVTADPVMNLNFNSDAMRYPIMQKVREQKRKGHPLITISLRPVIDQYRILPKSSTTFSISEQLVETMANVVQQLINLYDANILFCSMHPKQDDQIGEHLAAKVDIASRMTFIPVLPPSVMLSVLGQADMCLGMRLHSLIMASRSNVPLVALSYDPKVEGFMTLLGQQSGIVRPIDWNYETILKTTSNIWTYREEISEQISKRVPQLQVKASRNAQIVANIIR